MATATVNNDYRCMDYPEFMERLLKAQNHPNNCNQDIMTYAAWCGSVEALYAHLEYYESRAK